MYNILAQKKMTAHVTLTVIEWILCIIWKRFQIERKRKLSKRTTVSGNLHIIPIACRIWYNFVLTMTCMDHNNSCTYFAFKVHAPTATIGIKVTETMRLWTHKPYILLCMYVLTNEVSESVCLSVQGPKFVFLESWFTFRSIS